MHDLFKALVHECCDEWNIGYDHLDDLSSELILPESLQKLIDEINATKPPKATSNEILNYLTTHTRFSGWRGDVQHGTMFLVSMAEKKITY
jgi:hypothetical protein